MISEQFVNFEIAKDLQDLGFDENCIAQYVENEFIYLKYYDKQLNPESIIDAPLYQQVIDWFIEKHRLFIETPMYIVDSGVHDGCYAYKAIIKSDENYREKIIYNADEFPTKKKANIAAINEAIRRVKGY